MDSVSDIFKYHVLCFMTIIEVKVISSHQVKERPSKKFRYLEVRYMFLGQIFAKNAKNDHLKKKHFLKRQNLSKKNIRKITVKSRNDVKSACF